jgi:hypothetical protein
MWGYSQASGKLDRNGTYAGIGYSGHGVGCNNPAYQQVRCVGPIPQGEWTISGPPMDTQEHGPYVLTLTPNPETNTFSRSGFLIHGDGVHDPGAASEGCLILSHPLRQAIWESQDLELTVTP